MVSSSLKSPVNALFATVFAVVLLSPAPAAAQSKGKANVDKIPAKVMSALTARFPNPEIHKWSKEKENKIVLYDIEFRQSGQNLEADISEDGTIQNWEKEIAANELPAAVRQAVSAKYPKASIKTVMAMTDVKDGKDAMAGYEVVLRNPRGKDVEVTVAPDGKILEDSGRKK